MRIRDLLIIALLNTSLVTIFSQSAVVKINILKGDTFVTPNVDALGIERTVASMLKDKDYIITNINENSDLIDGLRVYFDLYMFQFPADFPTVILTARTGNSNHLLITEKKKLFGSPKSAILKLVQKVVDQVPPHIDLEENIELTVDLILSGAKPGLNLTRGMAQSITAKYRSNYFAKLECREDGNSLLPFKDEFEDYFVYCLDFDGYRGQVKGKKFKAELEIDDTGRITIKNLKSPIEMKTKHIDKISEAVDAIPLLVNLGNKPITCIVEFGTD